MEVFICYFPDKLFCVEYSWAFLPMTYFSAYKRLQFFSDIVLFICQVENPISLLYTYHLFVTRIVGYNFLYVLLISNFFLTFFFSLLFFYPISIYSVVSLARTYSECPVFVTRSLQKIWRAISASSCHNFIIVPRILDLKTWKILELKIKKIIEFCDLKF